jgi:putative oxidoreductase
MERFLGPYFETIYAVFRIVFGGLFWFHGAQKLFGWFGGGPPEMNGALWLAGVIELTAGALVALGLFAGTGAFVASGLMAGAYFLVHQPQALLPLANKGEMAILYCFSFLLIAAKGSGRLSVDEARGARL